MADKLGLSNEIKEIKLGKSFMKGDHPCFHTFRYDFMPASLDTTKRATVDIGEGHQVTVTVPHIEGSGTANTVFKGSKKPYQKECVLIIDHNTGEITLEKLSYNVQLKKTRAEGSSRIRSNTPIDGNFISKKSPSALKLSPQQKNHHPASFGRSSPVPKCSPLPKSPLGNQPSPNNNNGSNPPSMPLLSMLGSKPPTTIPETLPQPNPEIRDEPEIGVLTDSGSSSSSSSEDSSDSSSSDNEETDKPCGPVPGASSSSSAAMGPLNGHSSKSYNWKDIPNGPSAMAPPLSMPLSMPTANSLPSMPKFSQLSEDLRLSETSDSD